MTYQEVVELLGSEAEKLLHHQAEKIPLKSLSLHFKLPRGSELAGSDRSPLVRKNLRRLYSHGRLGKSGYLSIFPLDQGLEHSAAFSFYKNPQFFDPEKIVQFAVEGGCSAVTSSAGVLGMVSEKYARKIPFIVKLNHSEHLTKPSQIDQVPFSSVQRAHDLGAAGVGATVYFGSKQSHRQIEEVAAAFEEAHRLGLFTVLWCYPRNPEYKHDGKDYSQAVDVTAQACHIGVTMGADIIKQKFPKYLFAFKDLKLGKSDPDMYQALLTSNPIDMVRFQLAHCYNGRIALVNSGGESSGEDDLKVAIKAAVINKRAGGSGLMIGRKLFKKEWKDGLKILRAVQDVYLMPEIKLA
jgi:class I fructose-bisphosphate aldolase